MASTVITHRDRSPISMDELRRTVPSIFAEAPHDSRSNRYLYVPTVDLLDAMGREGFQPVWASQSRTRDHGRQDFTKHMIRLARPEDAARIGAVMQPGRHTFLDRNDPSMVFPEVILTNSHDGSSSVQLAGGMYRLACTNGLIVSEGGSGEAFRLQHSARWRDDIIEGTYRVIENVAGPVLETVHEMQARELTQPERMLLAEHAANLRWHGEPPPVRPEQMLSVRRSADREPTAWNTLNVLQENAIRGGLRYTHGEGRARQIRHTREVTGIDDLGRLNRGIWEAVATLTTGNRVDLAAEMFGRLSNDERAQLAMRFAS